MFKQSKKYYNLLYIVFLIISIIYMLINPSIIINSIKETLSTFTINILPTLFPFILCSQMILMLGGAKIIGYPLIIITRLLKLDDNVAGAYAASLVGGYPSGAASLGLLYSKNELKSGYLVSMILCSNCGPMFAIGTIGTVLLNSYGAGIIILISHIIGGIITAFLFSIDTSEKIVLRENRKLFNVKKDLDVFQTLDKSIMNTSKIMVKIFAFMGLFKLIGDAIFTNSEMGGSMSLTEVLFRGTLEIMDGCVSASTLDFYQAAIAACIIVSFGGMSAIFQSISITKEIPYNKLKFFIGKLSHGILSGLICSTLIKFIPYSVDAYAQRKQEIINLDLPVPNIMILLIAGCAVYIILRNLIGSSAKNV